MMVTPTGSTPPSPPGDLASEVAAAISSALAGGGAMPTDAPDPIGGFVGGTRAAETGSIWPEWAQRVGVGIPDVIDNGVPVYYDGDEFSQLEGLPLEQRVLLQEQLVALGLADNIIPGDPGDPESLAGMRALLSLSNANGERYSQTIARLTKLKAAGVWQAEGAGTDFDARPYLKPDYATMSQKVKDTFRSTLGRDPDQYELQQLAGELTGFFEMEHEAATEFDQLQHEASVTAGSQTPGPAQQVDPMSRFAELFETKYKHELDFVEDKEQAQVSRQVVQAGTDTLSQMSRSTT